MFVLNVVVVQINNVTDILFKLSHPKDMPHAHAPIHLCCVRTMTSPLFQMRKEKNNYVKQNTHNRTNEINKN